MKIRLPHPFTQPAPGALLCAVWALGGTLLSGFTTELRGAEELQGTQVWTSQRVSVSPRKDWDIEVKTEQRVSTENRFLRRVQVEPTAAFQFATDHKAFLGYKRIDAWDAQGDSSNSDLAVFGHNFDYDFEDHWRLSSRHMFQAGVTNDDSTGQFRHRVSLSYWNEKALWGFQPVLSNEWFYDFDTDRLSQNRLKLAFVQRVGKNMELEIFGMRRDDWLPGNRHLLTPVAGLSLNYSF